MQKTTDYAKIKIPANRAVCEKHVMNLVELNKENNLLDCYPIIVNEKLELFDGQHRLECAKRLGPPVYFIEKAGLKINAQNLLRLNDSSKAHSLEDKIEIATRYRVPEILKARKIWEEEPRIQITTAVELLGGWCTGGHIKGSISKGTYRVRNETKYKRLVAYLHNLTDLSDEMKLVIWKKAFIHSIAKFMSNYPERLDSLVEHQALLIPRGTRVEYLNDMLDASEEK